ncbi:MAG: TldD/PmbA family protein [Desulfurococcales archaeon]|nr:TldD/PmbA family protein [Desulfurococcales archaeon]
MNVVELVEEIVKIVKDTVPEYVVILEEKTSTMLKMANGQPSVVQSWKEYQVDLYAAKDQKIMASSFRFSKPDEAIQKTVKIIDKLQPSPLYAPLPDPSGKPYSLVDKTLAEMAITGDVTRLIEDLELGELSNSAGAISVSVEKRVLRTSNGADLEGARTHFNGYMRIFADDDSSGQWSWTSTKYDPVQAKKSISTAVNLAEECKKLPRGKIETGKYRVLLSPMVAGNLIESVIRAASGASVIFGMSFFRPDQIGQQLASEKLTIIDRPLMEILPGYSTFDDEGVATRDKPIIEKGVLKTLLHNSKTAKLLKAETTGNAGIIWPTAFNIEVVPGDLNDEEMMEILGNGLYATNNWYTRFQNYPEGLFSTVTRDALIVVKNGKPAGCAARARITGSMLDLIKNVEAVGKTRWPIEWWEVRLPSLLPHLLISEIGITSE